ncbi:MAG: PKD domain-containing protein [Chlorobi bacterium]|nr:PKD domain-containing protein [Chlorobiota bacterium]
MKKYFTLPRMLKLLAVLAIMFIINVASAQPWTKYLPQDKLQNHTLTLKDYQNAFNKYWEPFNVENGYYMQDGVKHKAGGWKQFKRWEWYWESRVNPVTGEFPDKTALEVFADFTSGRGENSSSGDWSSMGPDQTSGGYAGLGRLNCVGFSPSDNNKIYVGAAAGGVWKTTDGGSTWSPVSDSIAALGISDIVVVEKNGVETVYIGTGDRDHSDTYSVGVLKSSDGGATWNTTGLDWTQNQFKLINRMIVDPDAPDTIYAATTDGLYQTVDGGTSWSLKTGTIFIDIEFQPGNTAQIYGSNKSGQVYRSTNYGNSWTQVMSISGGKRTEIAVTADNSSVVYALVANSSSGLKGIYKSTNGGASFSLVYNAYNLLGWNCSGSGGTSGQGWYDLCIASDPNDENTVFVGGVNTWKSSDGGTTWNVSNHWWGDCSVPAVHADKHYLKYQNGTSTLFECNDGGFYKTSNGGSTWTHLGSGLVISQMYRLSVSQTASDEVIAGLQDNGTKAMLSGTWNDVIGGDGMECLIDYTDENTQYGELYFGDIRRTTNHWVSKTSITYGISGNAAWVTPYIIDKNDHATLYVGYQDVWKSTNQGNSWTQLSGWYGNTLRSLAIANNSDYIYAATLTTLYKTTDGGTTWTNITSGLPVSSSNISYISVKDDDPNTVWVSFSGFNSHGVYETTNGGSSWANISTGLPQLPVNCVIQDTSATDVVLYAGTDVGVYVKDGSNNWAAFYDSLPNVVVTELDIYYDSNPANSKIRAATFGRGLWESDLYSTVAAPVADFVADNTTPYTTDTVTFTDLSTNSPTAWSWEITPTTITYVDGTDSTFQNPKIVFDSAGLYTVSLTASNAGGSDTETKTDYIDASVQVFPPVADFEADTTHPSVIDTVTFTDLSTNVPDTWDWQFDPGTVTFLNGTDTSSQNPSVRFDAAGEYSVTLTVSNSAGSDDTLKSNYINAVDVLTVIATATPDVLCEGDSSQLDAGASGGDGNYTYSWTSDPAGFTSDEQSPVAYPDVTTTYFVDVSDGLQSASADVTVTVNALPVITLGDWPEQLCNQQEPPVQLTADPEGGIYSGNAVTSDGVFSPEEAPLGWNVITYTYEDENNCSASAQDSIFVDECVGLNNVFEQNAGLVIYPNPNNGSFIVESNFVISKLQIMNQFGTVVYSVDVNSSSRRLKLNLQSGFYYLKADFGNGTITKKVFIQ